MNAKKHLILNCKLLTGIIFCLLTFAAATIFIPSVCTATEEHTDISPHKSMVGLNHNNYDLWGVNFFGARYGKFRVLEATDTGWIKDLTAPTLSSGVVDVTTSLQAKQATIPTLNAGNATVTGALTVPTSITSTASAQNANVTGTARAAILMTTTPSSASISVAGASTANTISTSVAGGVFNGDFSLGEGQSIIATSNNLGWILGNQYGNTTTQTITNGMLKLTGDSNSAGVAIYQPQLGSFGGYPNYIPVYGNTTYRISGRVKADITSAGSSGGVRFQYSESSLTAETVSRTTLLTSSYLATSTDWATYNTTITTNANTTRITIYCIIYNMAGTGYYDDIKLEQVDTQIATAPPIDTFVYPSITGVTSEFVDQSQLVNNAGFAVGNSSGVQYWYSQGYTAAASSSLCAVDVYLKKVGTPLGNLIFEIRTDDGSGKPSAVVIASSDLTAAEMGLNTSSFVFKKQPVYALQTAGVRYQLVVHSDIQEATSCYYNWAGTNSAVYAGGSHSRSTDTGLTWSTVNAGSQCFDTIIAKNTNNISLTTSDTANQTKLNFGDIGLPDGAVVDLERGKFNLSYANSQSDVYKQANIITDAVNQTKDLTSALLINNFRYSYYSNNHYMYFHGTNASAIYTINTGAPIIGSVTVSSILLDYAGTNHSWQYSVDKVNWITLYSTNDANNGDWQTNTSVISGIKGYSSFYLRVYCPIDYAAFSLRSIEADIDTSTLNIPVVTPTGGNDLYASVNGGSYKANISSKYATHSVYTKVVENAGEISKIQASAQATRDRITPVTTGVVAELVASASGALVRSDVTRDSAGMWYFQGEVSVGKLTDRTPYFIGDSIAEIMAVTTIPGTNEIDHKSLGSARVPVAPEQELKFMDVLDATGDLIARVPGGIPIREITEEIPEYKLSDVEVFEMAITSEYLAEQFPTPPVVYDSTKEVFVVPSEIVVVATEEYSKSEALASVNIPEASAAEVVNTTKIIQHDRRDVGWTVSRLEDAIRKLEGRLKFMESLFPIDANNIQSATDPYGVQIVPLGYGDLRDQIPVNTN